jgi:quercetin dioxygenase-like cupin family protein
MTIISRIVSVAVFAASTFLLPATGAAQVLTPDHAVQNPNLNPRVIAYVLPADLHWTLKYEGLETAVVMGDPNKPGPYIFIARWAPNHMSHPHFHPNDRYITVLSGTWWVGTGDVYQPDKTVPLHAGPFITHFAKQVHYDGAKEDGCIIQIAGEGPAPSIDAEKK